LALTERTGSVTGSQAGGIAQVELAAAYPLV